MAGPFATVPIRARTDGKILVAWWNALRSAGILLETIFGPYSTGWTAFTFANNTGPSNITGCLLDSSTTKAARIEIALRRYTTTNRAICWITLVAMYDSTAGAWVLGAPVEEGPDPSGVTTPIVLALSGQQLQYTTDNMSGSSYLGASYFRIQAI